MKVILLSAGRGERLGSLTNNSPKVMLSILGKPILEHQINWLKNFGFREFLINLHFLPQKIQDYFGDGEKFGIRINYSYEEELLGTAGAIFNFKPYLKETFLIVYGDVINRLDFKKLIDFHKKKKGVATLVIRETDHPKDSDLIKVDKNLKIIKFYSKPHKNLPKTKFGNTGISILEPEILKYIPKRFTPPLDLAQGIFPKLLKKGLILYGYPSSEYIKDIGTPERYQMVWEDFRKKL